MKIVLFKNYGSLKFDTELKEEFKKYNFLLCRTAELVSYIEEKGKMVCKSGNGYYYEIVNKYSYFIEDVDITRPWAILEYDGNEYVQYLDYQIVDNNVMYCKLPN